METSHDFLKQLQPIKQVQKPQTWSGDLIDWFANYELGQGAQPLGDGVAPETIDKPIEGIGARARTKSS